MSRVLLPTSLGELWAIQGDEPGCAVFAGGTDLLVRKRAGIAQGDPLVCLERIPELREIQESNGLLRIGAGITHTACSASPLVIKHAPVLALALRRIGSPQVRNMGTMGGNICTASPAGDSLPSLHILKAEVVLRSRESERALPLADFIRGPGKTDLRPGEILTEVRIPSAVDFQVQHFEKVGQRNAQAIAVVSLAALVRLNRRGIVEEVRLALGSVGPTVVRPREAEEALAGRRLSLTALRQAAELVRSAVSPIDDIRATAAYRKEVAGNLLLRLAAL
ncbi:aerobic-type carbon monoxide dehydrogenase, middle subunit CoxM/CutM-like protein [Desulfocurvibacter africanus PCS]|uniref:Aerobic-type carbon monoxide dehydrogenase, middle subunit CoxM/CutM-like protein n=1 Tax=Desulfocurvibacter africanus PCS TaxID=1262666 RepID=M5PVD5_DESAF|nr:xanthine dehydrogenase family protein subunit M [Desulfocurvibacter africanus]EMG38004.1 aerobic-type carbon monoxide dehydrogenase, middle subunit CoxM/CutM-like protein [Desulfocurvibacter africanus PCS]